MYAHFLYVVLVCVFRLGHLSACFSPLKGAYVYITVIVGMLGSLRFFPKLASVSVWDEPSKYFATIFRRGIGVVCHYKSRRWYRLPCIIVVIVNAGIVKGICSPFQHVILSETAVL